MLANGKPQIPGRLILSTADSDRRDVFGLPLIQFGTSLPILRMTRPSIELQDPPGVRCGHCKSSKDPCHARRSLIRAVRARANKKAHVPSKNAAIIVKKTGTSTRHERPRACLRPENAKEMDLCVGKACATLGVPIYGLAAHGFVTGWSVQI